MFRRSWIMPTCSEPSHPSEAAASSPRTGSSSAAGYEAGPFDRCGGAGIPATSTSASRRMKISKALPKPPRQRKPRSPHATEEHTAGSPGVTSRRWISSPSETLDPCLGGEI